MQHKAPVSWSHTKPGLLKRRRPVVAHRTPPNPSPVVAHGAGRPSLPALSGGTTLPNAIGGLPTTGSLLTPLCASPLPKLRLSDGGERQITPEDIARFEAKIITDGECWTWTSTLSACGYGKFSFRDTKLRAHRFAYIVARGLIPDGLVLDHLCRNRACSNPSHLEAVTQDENVRRGKAAETGKRHAKRYEIDAVIRPLYGRLCLRPTVTPMLAALRAAGIGNSPVQALAARRRVEAAEPELATYPTRMDLIGAAVPYKTHCNNGHPYEGDNAGRQGKDCLVCGRLRWARRTGRDPEEVGKSATHCPQGHPYSGPNLYIDFRGHRQCRVCKRASGRRALEKKRAAEQASVQPCGHLSGEGNSCTRPHGHEGQHHARLPRPAVTT